MISLRLPTALSSSVLATVLVMPCVVYADSGGQPPAEVVHFSDLNLNNREGVRVLYRRIQGAARDVCAPTERTGTRIPSAAWQACMANAIKTAVQGVDRPLLTAYHDEHTGHVIQPTRTAASK